MLYIKKDLDRSIVEKYGYKKCKGRYGKNGLYYKCFARGVEVIFIGEGLYVSKWKDDDSRIHKDANCKYRSNQTALDEVHDLTIAGILEKRYV